MTGKGLATHACSWSSICGACPSKKQESSTTTCALSTGTPLVIHNIGGGAREEDALFAHPLTGHFRWKV